MSWNPLAIWRMTTAAGAAILLSAVLPAAPIAATAESDDREKGPRSAAGATGPAVYVFEGRVVAIRRDPLPPGAYGGQGVDYAPDTTTWVLGSHCGGQ